MKRVKCLIVVCTFLCQISVVSQNNNWRTYLEHLAEDGMDEVSIESMYEELFMLESNPINLNSVSREELERFSLISFEQASSIADFLEKNRPVYTVYELRNVPRLDFKTVELIIPFFFVGEVEKQNVTVSDMLRYGKYEISNRLDKTLNKRAGYGEFSDSILQRYPNRKYQGEDFYTSSKLSFSYRDKVQFGVIGEKDAGEPFFKKGYVRGYDHYGLHLIVRDIGRIKALSIGDYRLSFGQGLILNNDFMLSKSWVSSNIIRRTQEPKRHFSTAESGFFRGIALVYQIGKVNVTTFYSNKLFDANLSKKNEMTSFKTDGYHRTLSEIEKKNNSRERVMGANLNWRVNSFQIGVSGIYHKYDKTLSPTFKEYNIFYLRDSSNYNLSVDYSYRFKNISLAGETAIAPNGSIATLNVMEYTPSFLFTLSLLHRYLPVSYNALHAKSFTESSRVQNENGVYVGTSLNPFRNASITAYVDVFQFPWLRYLVDAPSRGIDVYFLGAYRIGKLSDFEIRYKYKQKEQNVKSPYGVNEVLPNYTQKVRLRYNYNLKSGLSFRSTFDATLFNQSYKESEKGFMISQSLSYRSNGKVQGDAFIGYFNSDSYATRLYSYERNISSTFYMPHFYGEGFRASLSGRINVTDRLSISTKVGYSIFLDRDVIGTRTEAINNNYRVDLYTFLRWRF